MDTQITLTPATEADLPSLVALQFTSFRHVLIEQIANPDTAMTRAAMLSKHRAHMHADQGLRIVKAVQESSSGEARIVGFCMFNFPVRDPLGREHAVLPIPLREAAEGTSYAASWPGNTNADTSVLSSGDTSGAATITATVANPDATPARPLYAPFDQSRLNFSALLSHRQALLKPLMDPVRGAGFVRYLSVDPSYRRLGIGRRLMAWGVERFDVEDVDVYLEATVEGEGLYRQFGFERFGEQVLTVDGVELERYACMWRDGKRSGNETGKK